MTLTEQATQLEDLLEAVGRGDADSFEMLYGLTSPRLLGYVLGVVKKRDWAEEVVQDVFLQIWRRADTFHPDRGRAIAWMTTIARHAAIDRLRRHRREHPLADDDLLEDTEAATRLPFEITETINKCLSELEENSRRAILLAYYYGYTHEELSEALDAPLGTLKSRVRRGLIRLKACLEL